MKNLKELLNQGRRAHTLTDLECSVNQGSKKSQVSELFATRKLLDHATMSGVEPGQNFWNKLEKLQLSIYALDSYFENNWQIRTEDVEQFWVTIQSELSSFTSDNSSKLLNDIRLYQEIEMSLRDTSRTILPRLEIYYYLKTCDVRLCRTLIEQTGKIGRKKKRLAAWNIFDQVSEVLDDFEDFDEDMTNFNGNRFLLGIGCRGAHPTLAEYDDFLDTLKIAANRLFGQRLCSPESIPLNWALERLADLHMRINTWRGKTDALEKAWKDSAHAGRNARQSPSFRETSPDVVGGDSKVNPLIFAERSDPQNWFYL